MLSQAQYEEDYGSYFSVAIGLLLFALAALALYFLWEGAPWHRNRGTESLYLGCCLITTAAAATCANHPQYDLRANASAKVCDILILVSLIQLYVQQVKLKQLPAFYSDRDPRPYTRREPKHKLSNRLAKDLSAQIGKLIQNERPVFIWLRASSLPTIVLAVVSMLRFCLKFPQVASLIVHTYFAIGGVLLFNWVFQEVLDARRHAPARDMIDSIFERVVVHEQKHLLNELLQAIDVPTLLLCGTREVFAQLTDKAVTKKLLDPFTKAILLNALSKVGVTTCRTGAVRRLILSCDAAELKELKSALDSTGDYFNLHKLIYRDVREPVRSELLAHLQERSLELRADGQAVGVKILSDIDDTVLCSGGVFPAGCDKRLPKKMVYPGFATLLRELDSSFTPSEPCSNVVFLSARPHIYKDISEQKTFRTVQQLFHQAVLHTIPSLLSGSLRIGFGAVVKRCFCHSDAWEEVGRYKHTVFQQYARLYREYDFIFFGDNGQGDLLAGQLMMQGPEEERPVAILIHQVLDLEKSLTLNSQEPFPAELFAEGILLHRTYVGAALALHRSFPKLISVQQLRSVAKCAQDDFDTSRIMYPEWIRKWEAYEEELSLDLGAASPLLASAGLPLLRCLQCTNTLIQEDEPFVRIFQLANTYSESSSDEESQHNNCCHHITYEDEAIDLQDRLWHLILSLIHI